MTIRFHVPYRTTRPWGSLGVWMACLLTIGACESTGSTTPTLTVAMAPGRIDDFNRIVAPGFEREAEIALNAIGLRSADQVARVRIERDRPTIDVLWIDMAEAQLLAGEGRLARVSERDVPNISEILDEALSPLGIAPIAFSSALGFLYNTELADPPPRSWAELWDERFEG